MRNKMKYRRVLLCMVFLFSLLNCYAGISVYNSSVLKGSSINSGTINVKDDEYIYLSTNSAPYPFINHKIKDFVSLQYTGALGYTYSAPWTVTVTFNVTQYDSSGALIGTISGQTLSVTYDPNCNTTDEVYRSDYEADWGDNISIAVTNVSTSGLPSGIPPGDVELSARIVVDRYWKMTPLNAPVMSHSVNTTNNTMTMAWSYEPGAESYDVEWFFRSNYAQAGEQNFSSATRVNLSNNWYTINLAYDVGWVCFRVRSVGKMNQGSTEQLDGVWSLYDSVFVNDIEPTMNWTYSAVYAEQGKVKEGLTFFDCSTRMRQAVTEDNTHNVAIVSETFYDHEGRASVTSLPTPDATNDSRLDFYSQLNQSTGTGVEYKASDFDNDAFWASASCNATVPNGMLSSQGASNYYSPSNPLKNLGLNRAIPDAQLLPFTETLYGPDGKVAEQADPGPALAMGGHTTKYFYGTPFQSDLDIVFGSEVGSSTHYREVVMQDANGQVNVTYSNLAGNIIATSLAGNAPANLAALNEAGGTATTYTVDITNQNSINGSSSAETSTLTDDIVNVAANSNYTFQYTFDPAQFSYNCPVDALLGMYDLEIRVTDDCGNILASTATPTFSFTTTETYSVSIPTYSTSSGNSYTSANTYITYNGNALYPTGTTITFSNNSGPDGSGTVVYNDGGLLELSGCTNSSLSGSTFGGAVVSTASYSGPPNVVITYPAGSGLLFVAGQNLSFNDPISNATIATGIVVSCTAGTVTVTNVGGSRAIQGGDIIPSASVQTQINPTLSSVTTSGGGTEIVGTGLNAPVQISFTLNFPQVGTYHIVKSLSIDKTGITDALASFTALYPTVFSTTGCSGNSLSALEQQYNSNIDLSECSSCQQNCISVAAQKYPGNSSAQSNYVDSCQPACNANPVATGGVDPCATLKSSIDADMSPGGQYFDDRKALAPASQPADDGELQALIGSNWLTQFDSWLGSPSMPAGCSYPSGGYATYQALVTGWQPCYVAFFEPHHPEWCRYQACQATDCSVAYDQVLANNNSQFSYAQSTFVPPTGIAATLPGPPAAACWGSGFTAYDFLNTGSQVSNGITVTSPTSPDNNPDPTGMWKNDPFFNGSTPGVSSATIASQLGNYTNFTPGSTCTGAPAFISGMSMWQVAITEAQDAIYCGTVSSSTNLDNLAWTLFAGFYEKEKQTEVDAYKNSTYCAPLCDAGVIAGSYPSGIAGNGGSSTNCNTPSTATGFEIRDEDINNAISAVTPSNAGSYASSAGSYSICNQPATATITMPGTVVSYVGRVVNPTNGAVISAGQPIYGFAPSCQNGASENLFTYWVSVNIPTANTPIMPYLSLFTSTPILSVVQQICNAINNDVSNGGYTASYTAAGTGYNLIISAPASASGIVGTPVPFIGSATTIPMFRIIVPAL